MAEADAGPGKGNSPKKEGRSRKPPRKGSSRRGKDHGRQRADLISAIDHPLRRRMLRLFQERDEALSAKQIAEELGVSLSTSSYHVRVLAELRALVLTGGRQVRGALQRFYRSTIENDPPVETLLEETREVDDEKGRGRKGGKKKGK